MSKRIVGALALALVLSGCGHKEPTLQDAYNNCVDQEVYEWGVDSWQEAQDDCTAMLQNEGREWFLKFFTSLGSPVE